MDDQPEAVGHHCQEIALGQTCMAQSTISHHGEDPTGWPILLFPQGLHTYKKLQYNLYTLTTQGIWQSGQHIERWSAYGG